MQEEQPATGAHGYESFEPGAEYVVVKGWGRGLRTKSAGGAA